jgi:hypothetical protein
VYADWLTEMGDIRGELIAWEHQLAVATLPSSERLALRRRADALVAAHREEWLEGLAPPPEVQLEWHHGFIVGVRMRWTREAFALLGEIVVRPVGWLLARLDLCGDRIGLFGVRELAAAGCLRSLTQLYLAGADVGAEGAHALAEGCSSLARLDLRDNALGDDGLRVLASAEPLGSLAQLYLERNQIGVDGALALAGGSLRSLARLDLSRNSVGDGGVSALAAGSSLGSLTSLYLGGNGIGPVGAQALAEGGLRSLTHLYLDGNGLGDEGVRALAAGSGLRSLRQLDLGGTGVTDEGARALAASDGLRSLQRLRLWRNDVSYDAARALGESLRGCRVDV